MFLPGQAEIRRLMEQLQDALPADVELTPLFGDLDARAQDAAVAAAAPGRRKVVLATALAESSLTIDGIQVVIDAGWSRVSRFDPSTFGAAVDGKSSRGPGRSAPRSGGSPGPGCLLAALDGCGSAAPSAPADA